MVKNGFTKDGNQRVFCNSGLKSRVLHRKFGQDFDVQSIRRFFLERMSLCEVCRVFLISYYQLIRKIPIEYLKSQSDSDHWKSQAILKAKVDHQQVGKESGQTYHIERY